MKRMAAVLILLLVTGCAGSRQSPPPAPNPVGETPLPPKPAETKPAWQHLLDSGSSDLFYAAPDGSGFLFFDQQTRKLVDVRTSEPGVPHDVAQRTISFKLGEETVEAPIAETPYGPKLVRTDAPLNMALSQDGQQLAIGHNGLWLADVKTGVARRIGAEPQPAPPNLPKHTVWAWADFPTWSDDGKWIYFYSSRLKPGELSRWRIPAGGGTEELVSKEEKGPFWGTRLQDGRVVRIDGASILLFPAAGGEPVRVADDLTGPNSLSPDGHWVVALSADRSALRTFDVLTGQRREIPLPPGSGAELSPIWNGSLALFRTRPAVFDGPAFLSVLDVSTGSLANFTPPEPARADVWPLGWARDGRVLARILPISAGAGVWILDRATYRPPVGATPSVLRSAQVAGPGPTWKQDAEAGPVTGGTAPAGPGSLVLLRFDQPLDGSWIQKEVQVEGPGKVEAHGAPLGVVVVRLTGAKPGEVVRVKVPALGFDLQVKL